MASLVRWVGFGCGLRAARTAPPLSWPTEAGPPDDTARRSPCSCERAREQERFWPFGLDDVRNQSVNLGWLHCEHIEAAMPACKPCACETGLPQRRVAVQQALGAWPPCLAQRLAVKASSSLHSSCTAVGLGCSWRARAGHRSSHLTTARLFHPLLRPRPHRSRLCVNASSGKPVTCAWGVIGRRSSCDRERWPYGQVSFFGLQHHTLRKTCLPHAT